MAKSQLKLLGIDFEVFDNPELKSMYGDLMGIVDAKDFVASETTINPTLVAIMTKWPKLLKMAQEAKSSIEARKLQPAKIIVRGTTLYAESDSDYGVQRTINYSII